jgi:hypothetical protein
MIDSSFDISHHPTQSLGRKTMKRATAAWVKSLQVQCPYCKQFQYIAYRQIRNWPEVVGYPSEYTSGLSYEHICDECQERFVIESAVVG